MHERNCRGMRLPAKMAKCWALNLQLTESWLWPRPQAHCQNRHSWKPEPQRFTYQDIWSKCISNTYIKLYKHAINDLFQISSSHIKALRSVGFSISSPVVSFQFAHSIVWKLALHILTEVKSWHHMKLGSWVTNSALEVFETLFTFLCSKSRRTGTRHSSSPWISLLKHRPRASAHLLLWPIISLGIKAGSGILIYAWEDIR